MNRKALARLGNGSCEERRQKNGAQCERSARHDVVGRLRFDERR